MIRKSKNKVTIIPRHKMSQKTTSLLKNTLQEAYMEFQQLSEMTNKEITLLLSKLVSKINDLELTRKIGDTAAKIELNCLREQVYEIWEEQRMRTKLRTGGVFPSSNELYRDKMTNEICTVIWTENENETASPWKRRMRYLASEKVHDCYVGEFSKSDNFELIVVDDTCVEQR